MATEIKFCGMMRPEDVAMAVRLGASHVGVIFAGGPRTVTPAYATELLREVPAGIGRVGVFDDRPATEIAAIARAVELTTVQLHGGPRADVIAALRLTFAGEIWAVVRVAGEAIPSDAQALFTRADAVLLDAQVPGRLGGTGTTLPWSALAGPLARARQTNRLVLAGGLRAENVAEAIRALRPDIVDVSSGVETSPGIKDHVRMQAFRDAVRGANTSSTAGPREPQSGQEGGAAGTTDQRNNR